MSTFRTNTITDVAGGNNMPVADINQGRAKAWLNMNGTGTVAVRDSFNVSSIVDVAAGTYGLNFASPLSNANYAPSGMADNATTACVVIWNSFSLTPSLSASRFSTLSTSGGAATDADRVSVSICGDTP